MGYYWASWLFTVLQGIAGTQQGRLDFGPPHKSNSASPDDPNSRVFRLHHSMESTGTFKNTSHCITRLMLCVSAAEAMGSKQSETITPIREDDPHLPTPISSLPTELLCTIFLYCVYQCRCFFDYPIRWIWICHVCQHWREVALHCPQLWARLVLARRSRHIDAFIQRS